LDRLDKLEVSARSANLTFAQTLRIFENVCDRLGQGQDLSRLKKLLRPVILEIVLRLFDEPPARGR
jgi:hypothetical protein